MQKTKVDLIAWLKEHESELDLLALMPNAIKRTIVNPEAWQDQYGDIQKDLVLAISGYQSMFKDLTGIDYQ